MLLHCFKKPQCGFAIHKKLFVYDSGEDSDMIDSGIRATIFGATGTYLFIGGFIGRSVAQTLGQMGSKLIMPIDRRNLRHYEHVK